MNIIFGNNKLKKYANSDSIGQRKLGAGMFRLFKRRLTQIQAARTLEDLRYAPGRFHELRENEKGNWACDLVHPYRLIFTPIENPVPTDNDGKYIWVEIAGVEIIKIEDYH